jgi:hypothetical protein
MQKKFFNLVVLANSDDHSFYAHSDHKLNFKIGPNQITLLEYCLSRYTRFSSIVETIVVLPPNFSPTVENNINNVTYFPLRKKTKGALMSLGLGIDKLSMSPELPILVIPVDAHVNLNLESFVKRMIGEDCNAGLIALESNNLDYSYLRFHQGKIIEIAEKKRISKYASSGFYFFKNKQIILDCIEWSLLNNLENSANFFVSPSLNLLVMNKDRIGFEMIDEKNYARLSNLTEARAALTTIGDWSD